MPRVLFFFFIKISLSTPYYVKMEMRRLENNAKILFKYLAHLPVLP